MELSAILFFILTFAVPKVRSIECYVCSSNGGNCQSGEKDCTTLYDRCMKRTIGNVTTKGCSYQILCNAGCAGKSNCEVHCCSGDLCNKSTAKEPEFVIVNVIAVFTSIIYRFIN